MNKVTTSLTALALAGTFSLAAVAPASADQAAATRNEILGGLALAAGVFSIVNANNKAQVANTVEGYTADGGTVYEDGHVALPNGQSYYPGNENQSVSCNDGRCVIVPTGYAGHRGWR